MPPPLTKVTRSHPETSSFVVGCRSLTCWWDGRPNTDPESERAPQAALFHIVSCFEFEDLVRLRRAGDGGQVRERVVARVEAQRQRLVIRYADSPAASSVFPLSDVGKINTSASARGAGVTIYGHETPPPIIIADAQTRRRLRRAGALDRRLEKGFNDTDLTH
ncbi:hypothetical protein DIPPA_05232 [Diplonema papillatum]|nr:hypothetical protein DIPPA_05232 [Diplonema papillatum]